MVDEWLNEPVPQIHQDALHAVRSVCRDYEVVLLVQSKKEEQARGHPLIGQLMSDDRNMIAYEQAESICHIVRHLQPAVHIDVDRDRAEFLEAHVPAVELVSTFRTLTALDLTRRLN